MRYFLLFVAALLMGCGEKANDHPTDSATAVDHTNTDSAIAAQNMVKNDISRIKDTVFHTALPTVFEGDILLEKCKAPQAQLVQMLMGGKYNHVGIIFQRPKDGILVVIDCLDSVRITPLTDYVDRADSGHVCLMRLKEANKTLTEEKVRGLRQAAKAYRQKPFDPVLNWDDSGLYSSELVWKIYNNAMHLTLCPTRKIGDFKISEENKKQLNKQYGKNVSDLDEGVSPDDIYRSQKLEIIYEK